MPMAMMREISPGIVDFGGTVRWGGDYSGNKDAMHFEIVASPAELATGIKVGGPVPLTKAQKLYWFLWAGKQAKKKPLKMGSESNPAKALNYILEVQHALGIPQTGTYGVSEHMRPLRISSSSSRSSQPRSMAT